MALDATAGGANANSYCTVAEADTYHTTHLYAEDWTSAVLAKKEAALIWATRLLDEQIAWKGDVVTQIQALRWPRSGVLDRDGRYYFDQTLVPAFLQQAAAEFARHLLAGDRTAERSIGITSVVADTVEVVFDKTDQKPFVPPAVRSMVEPYGELAGPGSGTARLVRV
jgi:hypothetical protein